MTRSGFELPLERLRWCCDVDALDFETTAEVEPMSGIVGQDDAVDALRFGLEMRGAGLNVYIRGLAGTGRMSLVRQLLEQSVSAPNGAPDRCYVHNFEQPDRPRLLTLPCGRGRFLRGRMNALVEFIEQQLGDALATDAVRARKAALDDEVQSEIKELGKPFEDELRANELAMVPVQMGQLVQPTIVPVVNGKPISYQELEALRASGDMDDATAEAIQERIAGFSRRFADLNRRIHEIQSGFQDKVRALYEEEARAQLAPQVASIKDAVDVEGVAEFLDAVVDDLVEHHLGSLAEAKGFTRRYRVNLVQSSEPDAPRAIVIENSPTLQNLLGSIEREFVAGGVLRSDHMMIQGGSLLRADGGYLVMEAREVLNEPGAWRVLMRTLRTGKLEILPSELTSFWSGPLLKPDAIDLDVKVILIGDPGLHRTLDALDPDFPQQFKVLSDFETTIERDETGVSFYAGVLARITREEDLPAFSRDAVAALVEQGARIAGRRNRLTTRFGRLSDIAREAAFVATACDHHVVDASHVRDAIARGRHRADLPARQFRKRVLEGTIRIDTDDRVIGQINGLAVVQAGPLTYGFPTRITATIGPGSAGAVNIEREAELSGAIHTKGFYILGGLLRHLLRTDHPLAFSASIAFEQSYGGIDGDSASGAEMCCLVSALTGVALDQGIAMTGAIDQHGHIQPIGAVSEKVEGFFAVCNERGLTGTQGVLIPAANAGDLMVEPEVVDACAEGRFHIHAVSTIFDALSVLTRSTVSERDANGRYPEGSLLHQAEQRAYEFWQMASASRER